jgi:hypothetical protein
MEIMPRAPRLRKIFAPPLVKGIYPRRLAVRRKRLDFPRPRRLLKPTPPDGFRPVSHPVACPELSSPTMNASSRLSRRGPAVCLVLFALAITGCASRASRQALPSEAIVTTEWENVYVTGSHIPVRVAKGGTTRTTPGISPLVVVFPDDFRFGLGPSPSPMH